MSAFRQCKDVFMMKQLAQPTFSSPIKDALQLKPTSGGKSKRSIVVAMMLTSLVDAFTIVVIYLIMNSSNTETLNVEDGLKLPRADYSKAIDTSPVVVFKNNQYIINGQIIKEDQLKNNLEILKKKSQSLFKSDDSAIVVQADENVDFDKLQPLLVASSYAGIKHVKFAVLQKD
jgi:biopolymer transport protein ExbD